MIIAGILQKQEQVERCDMYCPRQVFNFLEFEICLDIACLPHPRSGPGPVGRDLDMEFNLGGYDSLLFSLPLHEGISTVVMDRLEIF